MQYRELLSGELVRGFYRTKLSVSGFMPNLDNFPFSLLGEDAVERSVRKDVEKVRKRRLVFTINPGRAGSNYLASLLDSAANCMAFHEPKPRMNGGYLHMVESRPMQDSYSKRMIKIMGINKALAGLADGTVYVETSHMFIKTFYDVVLDYYDNVDVIVLRRPMHKVLKSFIELGFFSRVNPISLRWMHNPGSENCVADILKPVSEMDQYERCIAYLLDIEARAQAFASRYPKAKIYNVDLESILEVEGAIRLFQALGAEWSESSKMLYSEVVNRRLDYKAAVGRVADEGYCRERLHRYISQARDSGKSIPNVHAL